VGKKGSRKSATASALHSSIEDDTSPSTEPGVCPGLYHDELSFAVQASGTAQRWQNLHRFSSERIDYLQIRYYMWMRAGSATNLLRIEVFLAIGVLFEQFPGAVTKQFVIRDLHLEGLRFPCLV
jgi:hypothetical protein